jgi:hypothetical protein
MPVFMVLLSCQKLHAARRRAATGLEPEQISSGSYPASVVIGPVPGKVASTGGRRGTGQDPHALPAGVIHSHAVRPGPGERYPHPRHAPDDRWLYIHAHASRERSIPRLATAAWYCFNIPAAKPVDAIVVVCVIPGIHDTEELVPCRATAGHADGRKEPLFALVQVRFIIGVPAEAFGGPCRTVVAGRDEHNPIPRRDCIPPAGLARNVDVVSVAGD